MNHVDEALVQEQLPLPRFTAQSDADPHTFVLYVSCPLHKRNFALADGECLNDGEYQIMSFECREDPEDQERIQVLLPPTGDIDSLLGTDKWLVRQAESEALGLNAAMQIDILGPKGEILAEMAPSCGGNDCGDPKLSW